MGWGYTPPGGGGGGGGGVTLPIEISDVTDLQAFIDQANYQYVNIVNQLADGTLAGYLPTLLSTNGALGVPEGYRIYAFDGTDAALFVSMGNDAPPELSDRQPKAGDVYASHLYVSGSLIETSHRLWYVGADNGAKRPHCYITNGDTFSADSGFKNIWNGGTVYVDLSDDLTVTVADINDEDTFRATFVITALNSHVLTVAPPEGQTLNGTANPDVEGVWVLGRDASVGEYTWLHKPLAVDLLPAFISIRQSAIDGMGHSYRTVNTVDPTGSTRAMQWSYEYEHYVLDEDCDFTFAVDGPGGSAGLTKYVLIEGNFTITFPGSVLWDGGTDPAGAYPGTNLLVQFWTFDGGTTVYGKSLGTGFA